MNTTNQLKEIIDTEAELLWDNQVKEAMSQFPILMDAIQNYTQESVLSGRKSPEDIGSINHILIEIMGAIEQRDYLLMADLLKYELYEMIV